MSRVFSVFFKLVLFGLNYVLQEDEKIRKNRLSLLKKIADLPRGIADLSVLPGF